MADPSIQDLIRQAAQQAGVPPELALSVAEQESSFNPTAMGPRLGTGENAIGTFQILPSTAKRLGIDPNDPVQNIHGGVQYLRELLDRHQGDLNKVLAEYGGVKTDQKYVPGVLARMPKFSQGTAPPPPTTVQLGTMGPSAMGSREPSAVSKFITETAGGFDPRTRTGRSNLAGGLGAAAALAVTKNPQTATLVNRAIRVGTGIAGAYTGGAAEGAAETVAAPPSPLSLQGILQESNKAGVEQAKNEAYGQLIAWPVKAVGRRLFGSTAVKDISRDLSDAITSATSYLDSAAKRITGTRPAVTPAQAGHLVEDVAEGPAKAVKDRLGKAVSTAAQSGPRVDPASIAAKLDDVAQQLNPGVATNSLIPPAVQSALNRTIQGGPHAGLPAAAISHGSGLSILPPDHPLPGALDRARNIITDNIGPDGKISFETVHQVKRLLADAIDFRSPVRKQVQGATQGLRGVVRGSLAGHQPYDDANAAYGPVAKLYAEGNYPKLHRDILSNPEGLVNALDWKKPTATQLIKELTVDVPAQGTASGAQQGEAAWNAVRAAWTHENLVARGPKGMLDQIGRMEASGNGQQFIQTMYGDPDGQIVLQNLKQIGAAWEAAKQGVTEATDQLGAFRKTGLAGSPKPGEVLADAAAVGLHGHPIYKMRAMTRLVWGPNVQEMVQWAAYSPGRTNFLVKHVLTGPNVGVAVSDFVRWLQSSQYAPDKPVPSHTPGGPPKPTALAGR